MQQECHVDTGEVLELYANAFQVGYNVAEFLVDVGRGFEDTATRFHVRIITTPTDAKRLLTLLAQTVDNYEREFGPLPGQPDR